MDCEDCKYHVFRLMPTSDGHYMGLIYCTLYEGVCKAARRKCMIRILGDQATIDKVIEGMDIGSKFDK